MATYTDNYNLIKPTYAETADIVPLNNNFEKIDEVMHASQTSLAPAYDQTASYQPGDVVMYELNMYKCTGATSGTWDPSKWTRTTAAETGGGGSVDFDIFGEGSGSVVTITDGAEAGLAECIVEIEATQSGSGTPSPSNVRPIVGRSEVNVSVSGKNLFGYSNGFYNVYYTSTAPTGDGSHVPLSSATGWMSAKIRVKGLETITVSGFMNQGGVYSVWLGSDDITDVISTFSSANNNGTKQVPSGAEYLVLGVYNIKTNYENYPNAQIEEGSEATEYEPYNGSITTIPLDRTVYGGTLDVTTGELTVTHACIDLGSFNWVSENTALSGLARINVAEVSPLGAVYNQIPICSQYEGKAPKSYSQFADGEIAFSNSESQPMIRMRDGNTSGMTDAQIKTYMSGVTFCYELATPQTYNLTPTQVLTLLGQNYVSHDGGGTISLVYVKGDAPIKPNPADAEIPLTGLEISGKDFVITDARIPAPPTTNGAYVLTVTVSGGTPTYSWANA